MGTVLENAQGEFSSAAQQERGRVPGLYFRNSRRDRAKITSLPRALFTASRI